ncbi:MAG: PilT/PilU family type 4a pilus ATPase [Endozoicomonas sp. (ex Botrylloides leachii)]|nr:PilT/PilU family type 4a pilus ATPase [Endozoicomonas sp. (ex Botrylloides leachii)]
MDIFKALKMLVDKNGSDLFVTVGLPLTLKINNQIQAITKESLSTQHVTTAINATLNEDECAKLHNTHESNCAVDIDGAGRFRISAFYQKGEPGMVIKRINTKIPTLSELGLPAHLSEQASQPKGLTLITGPAGSGKSTTMASLISHRNAADKGHIILIEDPIEYVHTHNQCIITQRDVGLDTASYEKGLINALRQSPNIIAIGEIRSLAVMKYVLTAVETGHHCIATLHANNSYQALERIIHFFPLEQRSQILMDLSLNIKAIIGQQLIESKARDKIYPAVEVMLNSPTVADLIRKGAISELKDVITKSREQGMQTFDQSLYDLYEAGKISYEKALLHATSANDLRLMIKLKGTPPTSEKGFDTDALSV